MSIFSTSVGGVGLSIYAAGSCGTKMNVQLLILWFRCGECMTRSSCID